MKIHFEQSMPDLDVSRTVGSLIADMSRVACLIIVLTSHMVCASADLSTLQLVSMLYRHGNRAPMFTFPTNPVPVSVWPQGLASLTLLGMRQQHELGAYMRKRYIGFINSSYSAYEIRVRSTDNDRTLLSAESHLSGLYPPSGHQKFDLSIDWQPIPVHTVIESEDNLLSTHSLCPRATTLYNQDLTTSRVKSLIKKYQPMFDFVGSKVGVEVTYSSAWKIIDAIECQRIHNFSSPSWYNASIQQQLRIVSHADFLTGLVRNESIRLRGGSLLKEITANMLNKTDGLDPKAKIYMYSGHDITIAAFLQTLRAYPGVQPPFAATVLVELHKNASGEYYIQLLYKDSLSEPRTLLVNGCAAKCPLHQFMLLTKQFIPSDWRAECGFTNENYIQHGNTIYAVLCGLVGAAIMAFVILAVTCVVYIRKRQTATSYRTICNELDY